MHSARMLRSTVSIKLTVLFSRGISLYTLILAASGETVLKSLTQTALFTDITPGATRNALLAQLLLSLTLGLRCRFYGACTPGVRCVWNLSALVQQSDRENTYKIDRNSVHQTDCFTRQA